MGCHYGIDGRHGSVASFGSELLEVDSNLRTKKVSSDTKAT